MRVKVVYGLTIVLVAAVFVPIVSAMVISGSSASSTGTLDADEDVKWMHNLWTPDAILTGSSWVWTHIDLDIFHWGSEPAPGGTTGGTHSGTQLPAFVKATNDQSEIQPVEAGWSFYSDGSGSSVVSNASINCSYTVQLRKLVVDKDGSSTTYHNVCEYVDSLAGTDSLPHGTPPTDGDDLDYDIPVGGYYKITAVGRIQGSWSGANGSPGPTNHGLVPAAAPHNGVNVHAVIEIDIAEN